MDTPSKFLNTSKPFLPKFDLTVSCRRLFSRFTFTRYGNALDKM